jgi:general nucleoside transport system permease protein
MTTAQLVLATGIALLAPILWAALGELITEVSGVINVGIEGVMIVGAFATVLAFQRTGSSVAAIVAAAATGLACAVVLGALYVGRAADQIVTGIVFSSAAVAIAAVLAEKTLASDAVKVSSLPAVEVPVLSTLPWLGPVLFRQNVLIYGALLAVPCVAYLMHHTWFGLHARAAGERPLAIETAGVSVRGVRFTALIMGCLLVAIGGATLVLSTATTFQPGVTGGRGYIALAVVVLARWHPGRAVLAALIFGLAQALQFQADRVPLVENVPTTLVLMTPYAVAVVVVLLARGSRYPAAVGAPYRPRTEQA